MDVKLSILIPTIPERKEMFDKLKYKLFNQKQLFPESMVEILFDGGLAESIGTKRNGLLSMAQGEYVCFIDDDDDISDDYLIDIINALESKPDCVSLRGVITWDGSNPEIFEHSLRYPAYVTHTLPVNGIKYERYPNHLNTIKSSIAKQFKFPEINFGEDTDWSTQIHNSGLINTEVYLDKVIYHYLYRTNKKNGE